MNPFFIARRALATELRALAPRLHGRVLDAGCGCMPYRPLFHVDHYVGVDVDVRGTRGQGRADVLFDGRTLPFGSMTFDGVLCTQVLEHVFEPERFLGELSRVLKPEGVLLLTVPFVWDEHEVPNDFARYSSYGLRALLERNGFTVEVQRKTAPDLSMLFQLGIAYVHRVLPTTTIVQRVACATLMAPLTVAGVVLGRLLPTNPALFLDQVVLARRAPSAGKR